MKEEETVSHPSEVRFHYHADWRTGLGAGGGAQRTFLVPFVCMPIHRTWSGWRRVALVTNVKATDAVLWPRNRQRGVKLAARTCVALL